MRRARRKWQSRQQAAEVAPRAAQLTLSLPAGPVWKAARPFVKEAWRLMSSVDETLSKLVSRGFPLEPEADRVHEGLKRLQTMLEREIDATEAQQAAGERAFVTEQAPLADIQSLPIDIESEDGDDDSYRA